MVSSIRSFLFLVTRLTETTPWDSSSDLISSSGTSSRSWSLSNKMPLLWFSPIWTFPLTGIFSNSFKPSKDVEYGFFVTLIRSVPDYRFLIDFGVPTIPWMLFWIKNWGIFVKGFGCKSDSTASGVMKRGQCSAGENVCSSFGELYVKLFGKNVFGRR